MVTPPGLRMVGPVWNAMLSDDWSRVAKYNVWTMFPFGRMARDIAGEGNLIENPGRIFEKIGGIPVQQYQRKLKAWKEEKPPVTYAKGPIEL